MFDMKEFFQTALVGSVPLILVVLGLVEWLKSMGLSGKVLTVSSLVIGLLFGGAYQMSVSFPVTFANWFSDGTYGLMVGLVASGIYKVGVNLANQTKQ